LAFTGTLSFHRPYSISFAGRLELSYTAQASAKGRYTEPEFA
jgi:hypothetical protein